MRINVSSKLDKHQLAALERAQSFAEDTGRPFHKAAASMQRKQMHIVKRLSIQASIITAL